MVWHRNRTPGDHAWRKVVSSNLSITLRALVDSRGAALVTVVLAEVWKHIVARCYLVAFHADLLCVVMWFNRASIRNPAPNHHLPDLPLNNLPRISSDTLILEPAREGVMPVGDLPNGPDSRPT